MLKNDEDSKERAERFHAGGTIKKDIVSSKKKVDQFPLGEVPEYEDDVISGWVPHMRLAVADEDTGNPMTSKQITAAYDRNSRYSPQYFANPMQSLDYIVIEGMLKNTFIGPLMNALTKFIVGRGFRPELELINPDKDPKKNQQKLDEHQYIIDTLLSIDNNIDYPNDDDLDIPFHEKIFAMFDVANSFNRSALIFGYESDVMVRMFEKGKEIDTKNFKGLIPSSMKFAHPRDLGIIDVAPKTWRLKAVQWAMTNHMIPAKDMIYIWNPLISAKYHNSWLYGGSMILPMLDASRVIRRIVGVDFPAMSEATWAGMFILAVKPQGQTITQKQDEYGQVANNMVRGGPSILMEDPDNLSFHTIDYKPKVTEFKDLVQFLLRLCVSSTGLPQTMFYDESESTRATMIGKIQLARTTVIEPIRKTLGGQLNRQWYHRWYKLIYGNDPAYKEIRVRLVFNDLHIEEWFDQIEAVLSIDARKQLKDSAFGELAGIEQYENKVEEGVETSPGGQIQKDMGDGPGTQKPQQKQKTTEPSGDK